MKKQDSLHVPVKIIKRGIYFLLPSRIPNLTSFKKLIFRLKHDDDDDDDNDFFGFVFCFFQPTKTAPRQLTTI